MAETAPDGLRGLALKLKSIPVAEKTPTNEEPNRQPARALPCEQPQLGHMEPDDWDVIDADGRDMGSGR
jgi:hypothetical protein